MKKFFRAKRNCLDAEKRIQESSDGSDCHLSKSENRIKRVLMPNLFKSEPIARWLKSTRTPSSVPTQSKIESKNRALNAPKSLKYTSKLTCDVNKNFMKIKKIKSSNSEENKFFIIISQKKRKKKEISPRMAKPFKQRTLI